MSRATSGAPLIGHPSADPAASCRAAKRHAPFAATLKLAEIRVLAAGLKMRATCLGLDRECRQPGLDDAERGRRLADLERLWAGGCRKAVDEVLFRDIAARHPDLAMALRARLRRRQSSSSAGTGIGRP